MVTVNAFLAVYILLWLFFFFLWMVLVVIGMADSSVYFCKHNTNESRAKNVQKRKTEVEKKKRKEIRKV